MPVVGRTIVAPELAVLPTHHVETDMRFALKGMVRRLAVRAGAPVAWLALGLAGVLGLTGGWALGLHRVAAWIDHLSNTGYTVLAMLLPCAVVPLTWGAFQRVGPWLAQCETRGRRAWTAVRRP